ncbi:MAG: aryl-sulfate sulfotransferase [bacterium]|nr:aryl-sulfate sulfotransferase [bacterium]
MNWKLFFEYRSLKQIKRLWFVLINSIFFIFFASAVFAYPSVVQHGVTIDKPTDTYDGFTLYTPVSREKGKLLHHVYLVDMQGDVVHSWPVNHSPGLYGFLLKDSTLLYAGSTSNHESLPGGGGGVIQEIDWDGNIMWEYKNDFLHHDFDKLPNGNIMAIMWEPIKTENMDRIRGGIIAKDWDGVTWSDVLIEIDYDTKEIVWEWHTQDMMQIENYSIDDLNNRNEWTHANTVEYLPAGNSYNGEESVLTSFRYLDTVMIINKATGEISWEWGDGILNGQHDSTLLENGNVLLYDNGMHRPALKKTQRPNSKVIEVNPQTNEIVWEYQGDGMDGSRFFSGKISGTQRLPNGNTLITEGDFGRIFEVKPNGKKEKNKPLYRLKFDNEIVWEYISPHYSNTAHLNAIFRSYRYGLDDIDWPVDMPDPRDDTKSFYQILESNKKYIFYTLIGITVISVCLNIVFFIRTRRRLVKRRK